VRHRAKSRQTVSEISQLCNFVRHLGFVTSFIKLEVHKIRSPPDKDKATCTENLVKFEHIIAEIC